MARHEMPPSEVISISPVGTLDMITPVSNGARPSGKNPAGRAWGARQLLPPSGLARTSSWQRTPFPHGDVTAQTVLPPTAMSYVKTEGNLTLFQVMPPSCVTNAPLNPYTKPSRRFKNRTCLGALPSVELYV